MSDINAPTPWRFPYKKNIPIVDSPAIEMARVVVGFDNEDPSTEDDLYAEFVFDGGMLTVTLYVAEDQKVSTRRIDVVDFCNDFLYTEENSNAV